MKRVTLFMLSLALLLIPMSVSLGAQPAQNAEIDDLTRLAAYAPPSSAFFATIRHR